MNRHDDTRYDWAVIDRLRDLDERAGPVVRRLRGPSLVSRPTARPYGRPAAGSSPAKPTGSRRPCCDSYHTVWMRLHEDLLLATGAQRHDEVPME